MEDNSVLHTIVRKLAVNCGFIVAALLMFFGIMDYKRILEEAKSPQRHVTSTFFLAVLALYFVTFVVFSVAQCIDAFKVIFASHKVAPLEEPAELEQGAQPQPQP